MKKAILIFGLVLLSNTLFGQMKQVKLTDKEVNDLGFLLNNRHSGLTPNDIETLNLKKTIGYLLEFKYENKTIAQKIIPVFPMISEYGYDYFIENKTGICFNMSDIGNDIAFSLLKNQWKHIKTKENEEFICSNYGGDVSYFETEDRINYKMNTILDEKIKLVLYRLEKE